MLQAKAFMYTNKSSIQTKNARVALTTQNTLSKGLLNEICLTRILPASHHIIFALPECIMVHFPTPCEAPCILLRRFECVRISLMVLVTMECRKEQVEAVGALNDSRDRPPTSVSHF